MADFLLEIGCEEIPARFLGPALDQLRDKLTAAFDRLRIAHGSISVYGTPRRLAIAVSETAEMQAEGEERKIGPFASQAFGPDGNPTKAAHGFAKSCGVEVSDLGREPTPKGDKLLFVKKVSGRPTAEVLAETLPELIRGIEFPKPMRWGRGTVAFVRPIHWVLALLGGKVIGFKLDGIESGNKTYGHRFTHPESAEVSSIADYLDALERLQVMADRSFRREVIERETEQLAREMGGELIPDPGLMTEVTDLVEFPVVIGGRFDERYLELPAAVPMAAMRTHQRYFGVRNTAGELMPFFITVANTPAKDLRLVERGNERVLSARLADAEFYWKEDLAVGLEKMREGTAGMVYYKTLGSYLDKSERVARLAEAVAQKISDDPAVIAAARAAGRLCKADLVSQMVGNFTELQGVMGGAYAHKLGLGGDVAQAISEHYLPQSADDIENGRFPCSVVGDAVSLADKIDSVVLCWAAGLAPTGAGDPFALRRQAQGVVNLILAKGYRISLPEMIELAAVDMPAGLKLSREQALAAVKEFFVGRVRGRLMDEGLPFDVVDATLAVWNGDILDTLHKAQAVGRMKSRPDFAPLMIAFRRVMNIVEGQPGPVNQDLFSDEAEAVLYSELTRVRRKTEPLLGVGGYDQALELMASLKPAVDQFFEKVLVNIDLADVRTNRHALCAAVANLFKMVADFSRIVIEGEKTNP